MIKYMVKRKIKNLTKEIDLFKMLLNSDKIKEESLRVRVLETLEDKMSQKIFLTMILDNTIMSDRSVLRTNVGLSEIIRIVLEIIVTIGFVYLGVSILGLGWIATVITVFVLNIVFYSQFSVFYENISKMLSASLIEIFTDFTDDDYNSEIELIEQTTADMSKKFQEKINKSKLSAETIDVQVSDQVGVLDGNPFYAWVIDRDGTKYVLDRHLLPYVEDIKENEIRIGLSIYKKQDSE